MRRCRWYTFMAAALLGCDANRGPNWHVKIVLIAVAVTPALAVGLLSLVAFVKYTGPQYDVVIFNDHMIGGAQDRVMLLAVGTLSLAVVVFCVLRARDYYLEWRRRRDTVSILVTSR